MPEIDMPTIPMLTVPFMPEIIMAAAIEYVAFVWRLTPETMREIIVEGIDAAGIDHGYEDITP